MADDGFRCTIDYTPRSRIGVCDWKTGEVKIIDEKEKKEMNKLQDKNIRKIEITQDGDNVIAKAYKRVNITDCSGYVYDQGWSLVEKATAKCGPNDIFDFNIGAKLALDRLYEGYDMTPKPKRKPYNGKIFVQRFPGSILLPNHIYNVRNGVIDNIPLINRLKPFIFADMTDADLSCAVYKNLYSACVSDIMAACCSGCFFVKG